MIIWFYRFQYYHINCICGNVCNNDIWIKIIKVKDCRRKIIIFSLK